jgi:glycerol-3-phosphate dehydrogenase (NAD(P)+)
MNIGIIGLGAWGSALANLVQRSGHFISDNLATSDLWIIAVSADSFRAALAENKSSYNNQPIVICTKGMEMGTHMFMSQVLADVLPDAKYAILSGPQFAAEVKNGIPTGTTLAGAPDVLDFIRDAFSGFYLEETDDVIGTELCGVGKNACAIVAGYYSVIGAGENERALMLTRAWTEVATLGEKIGAKMRTFIGLCGTGDLFLSATSKTSRNFSAGVAIANGQPLTGTIEGLSALKGLVVCAKEQDIQMPVIEKIAGLLN